MEVILTKYNIFCPSQSAGSFIVRHRSIVIDRCP